MITDTTTHYKYAIMSFPLITQFVSRSYVKPSPYGNVLIMSPWTYPFLVALDSLADILVQRYGVEVTMIAEIGPVIGSHAGSGTIALFFIGKHR